MSQVFISYKTGLGDGLTQSASTLEQTLQARGFKVWRDETKLKASDKWSDQIYESIRMSEVLLLLLSDKVVESEWVRREVDVAKGAHVTIVPVLIRDVTDSDGILSHFDLAQVQYVDWRTASATETENLEKQVVWAIEKTQKRRSDWMQEISFRKACKTLKEAYTYKIARTKGIRLHIASGDLTEMHGIDVIVNTENDYMQMGRYFEVMSVSSQLRLKGSRTDDGGSVEEDTMQLQLYNMIQSKRIKIPVQIGRVIITPAGHPLGDLRSKNKNRYVFHLVTAQVNPIRSKERFRRIEEGMIDDAINNCFEKVIEVNAKKGVISPKGKDDYKQEQAQADSYQPIQSIIIPLFGTGHAGNRDVRGVARAVINGAVNAAQKHIQNADFSVKDIYIAAYTEDDLKRVKQVMDENKDIALVTED